MSTPGGKVSVFTGYGTGKTQSTAGAARRKEAKPPTRRRGGKRQIPARQAPWGGNERHRPGHPPGPTGRAAEAGSTPPQSRKENRKAPKKEKRGAKKKRRRAGERAEKQIRCIQNKEQGACKAKLRPRDFHNIRGRTQRQVCAAGRIQNPHGERPDAKCRDLPKERRQTHKRRVYAQSLPYKINPAASSTSATHTAQGLPCEINPAAFSPSATYTAQDLPCKINPAAFQHKRHIYCAGYVHRYCAEESRTGGVHTEKQRHAYMAEEQRSRSEGIAGGSEKDQNAPSLHPLLLFPHRCGIIVKKRSHCAPAFHYV